MDVLCICVYIPAYDRENESGDRNQAEKIDRVSS